MQDALKITFLGTGTPVPNADAYGTSTLIEAGGQRVLLDCGRGTVVRLAQAGFPVGAIDRVFLSHYHSDHYVGLFDLLMTGAIPQRFAGRKGPLHVHGPVGLGAIAEGAWLAATPDRDIRVADGEMDPERMRIIPHVYTEGVVHDIDGLRIIAIEVDHGDFIRPAFAFRAEYAGKVFVHSHDTRYNENLIRQSQGADVMVHEVAAARPATLRDHPAVAVAINHHSTPAEVGRVFARVRPRLAMLTHLVFLPPDPVGIEEVMEELGAEYGAPVVVAEDLMSVLIGRTISVIPYHRGSK